MCWTVLAYLIYPPGNLKYTYKHGTDIWFRVCCVRIVALNIPIWCPQGALAVSSNQGPAFTMSLLFYRRPDYVEKHPGPMDTSDYQKYLERNRAAIPKELCFENVIANSAMPVSLQISKMQPEAWRFGQPCSLQDFMGYLLYVAHDAENLQFYIWLQEYTKRFDKSPSAEQALSPPWVEDKQPPTPERRMTERNTTQKQYYQIDFDQTDHSSSHPAAENLSFFSGSNSSNYKSSVESANAQSGLKWQSCKLCRIM